MRVCKLDDDDWWFIHSRLAKHSIISFSFGEKPDVFRSKQKADKLLFFKEEQ